MINNNFRYTIIKNSSIVQEVVSYSVEGDYMKKSTILRTIFVCSFLLVAMLVYEITSNYGLSEKTVKANATPITNKVIVLDAGHRLSR